MDRVNCELKFPKLSASLFHLLLPKLLFPLSSCLKEESFSRHETYPRQTDLYSFRNKIPWRLDLVRMRGRGGKRCKFIAHMSRLPQGSPGPPPLDSTRELEQQRRRRLRKLHLKSEFELSASKLISPIPSRSFCQMLANFSGIEF